MQIYSIEITFVHYPNQIMIMFSVDTVCSDWYIYTDGLVNRLDYAKH